MTRKTKKGNEKKAVRVWHQEIGDIKQRYNLISADIHKYGAPYLCDVDFMEGGLDVDGTLIDIVTIILLPNPRPVTLCC